MSLKSIEDSCGTCGKVFTFHYDDYGASWVDLKTDCNKNRLECGVVSVLSRNEGFLGGYRRSAEVTGN